MSDYSAVAPPQNFNQSSAFAAALQRAKQIAAKINPATTGQKRPHEEGGPEPDSKKIASLDSGPPGFGGPNRAMSPPQGQGGISAAAAQAAAQAAAVAARVAAAQSGVPQHGGLGGGGGPVHTEDIRVPDKMVGLIIGRGGEQITRLQSESGCKIQMAADSNGQPDRVCSLAGPRDAIQRAKDMIFSIVHTHQRGGRHEPPSQNAPGDVGGGNFGGGGGGGGGGMSHVEIMVPGPKVGLIIGKGGETIKQLQEKSGAKMVVIQDGPNPEQEKPLRISGDPQKVEYAKQLVYDLIAEKEMQAYRGGGGGGGGGGRGGRGGPGGEDHRGGNREGGYGNQGGYNGGNQGGNQDYGPPGTGNNQDGVEVQVPRAAVGVVIGKGGDMIKKIQAETGARVQFQQGRDDGPGDRRCLLTGKPQNVEAARQRIEELIDSVHRRDNEGGQNNNRGGNNRRGNNYDQRNSQGGNGGYGGPPGGNWGPGPQGGHGGPNNPQQLEVTFQVPTYKCGVIIGRGGETIKQINQQSGAHCELDRKAAGNGQEKTFIIRGDPESVENAKMIISEKIQLPIYFTPVNGAPNQPPQPNAPNMNAAMPTAYPGMAPQAYTPQGWGANTGYQQQWPQPGQQSDPNAAAPAQVQINPQTGQPDYSKQWAEYYRSLGMHREADMIEQQAKAGQPGVQPGMPGQPTAQNPPGVPNAPGTQSVLLTPYAGAAQNQIPQQQQPISGANPVATSNAATNGSTATISTGASGGAGGGAGQPDYSAQWAEYYRSIGKVKEAEAIEAQMKNKGPGGSSQPSGAQPGAAQPGSAAGQPGVMGVQAGAPQAAPLGGMAATGAPIAAPGQFPAYGGYQAAGYYPTQQAANPAAPQGSYNFPAYGAYGQPQTTTPDN